MKTKEWFNKVLESKSSKGLTAIEFGYLVINFGIVPMAVAVKYLFLFGLTKAMAYTIFVPSILSTIIWLCCKNQKWFKKKYYW